MIKSCLKNQFSYQCDCHVDFDFYIPHGVFKKHLESYYCIAFNFFNDRFRETFGKIPIIFFPQSILSVRMHP